MKRTIQDTNFVTIQGWVITHLHLSSDEAIVYSLIYGYKEGFREPISYIAQWIGKSDMTARRTLQHLVQMGYIEKKTQSGKPTAYVCTPLTNCKGSQNATPNKNDSTPLPNCKGSIYNNDNNIIPPLPPARTHAREKLTEWVAKNDLEEWTKLQFFRNGYTVDIDIGAILDEFYDNDFEVREDCEQSRRMEVLKHFQNWLPKYINKLKNEQNNGNNHTSTTKTARNSGIISPEDFARSFGLGWNIGKREQ